MKPLLLFMFLFVNAFLMECFSQSAVCAYKYRKRITIDPTKVSGSSDLSNFPVLISITADNDLRTVANSGHVENSNGFDIVFTSADGVTLLTFQAERYSATTGLYTAWVLVPNLSTSINTYLYMYYGNTAIATDQSSTAVWSNYHGVWHLQNSSFSDNSPSGYNLTNNSTTNMSPAFINDGRANNGTQWLEVANTFPNITSNFSMSAWFYTTNNTLTGQRVFCDDVNNTGGYALSLGDGGTGSLRFFSRSSNPVVLDSPNNTIANNTWYYVSAVADITNLTKKIYVNGVQVASGAYTNTWGTDAGNCSVAGETASGETANRLNGRIDEVRVAKSALSADWLLTEYNNQNSPSTFYTISAEPKVWTGGTSTAYATATNWLNSSTPASGNDVIINNGSNQPTLGSDQQVNSIYIKTGATLSLSNRILSIRTDITNCGTISGGTGEVNLNGAAATTQTQYISGSGTNNFNDLTINNAFSTNPSVVLNKDVNVAGALALTSGIVYSSNTNILALGSSATAGSGSSTSFISGPVSKVGSTNFVFPIGKGTRWRRAEVRSLTASTTFRAEYFNAAFTSTTPVNTPLNNVSSIEYWQIDRIAGTGNAIVALFWESANTSGITNCPDLTVARWNGSSWDEHAAATTGGASCSGTGTGNVRTNAVVTSFSPFTFGSKLNTVNPLPISLIEFKGTCADGKIKLTWSTASEHQNEFFIIERSSDGTEWETVSKQKGNLESNTRKDYSCMDNSTATETMYYRLSQVDSDGSRYSFPIISIVCSSAENTLHVFPNPFESVMNVNLDLSQNYGLISLKLRDPLGRICFEKQVESIKGLNSYSFETKIEPGVYLLQVSSEQADLFSKKVLVQ